MRSRTTMMPPTLRPRLAALALVLAACSAVSAVASEEWVLPDDRLGIATAPILFLSRPDVQEELRLDPNQVADARQKMAELYRAAAALKGKSGAEALAARRSIDGEQKRWLNGHLTREQLGRLAQIEIQWEGPVTVIRRPFMTEALRLRPGQHETLEKAVANRETKVRGGTPIREADHELAALVLGTLDDEQKTLWKSMLGEPFKVKPIVAASTPETESTRR